MKNILLLFLLISLRSFSQGNDSACDKLAQITALIQKEHYHPKPLDDSLSVFVFDTFMDGLDPTRNIFTKSEYDALAKHRKTIDDEVLNNGCTFFEEAASVYKKALERKQQILRKLQNIPVDYNLLDTLRFSRDNFPFDMRSDDQERILKKRIKVEIFDEISKMSNNLDSLKRNFTTIEKTVRPKIFETDLCKISSVLEDKNGFKTRILSDFLNDFCNYFDPHSNYFTVDAKSSFMSMLSTSNLSLGINFGMNEKEELVVDEVVPGGPAAKSGKIAKDDVIVKVADKDGNGYLLSCTSLDAVGDLIYSDNNKEMLITVRKKNGESQQVRLKKQFMKATDNNVYSFIAEKDTRVGYIKIPSFYSDFEGNNVTGCADQVAQEILKLQNDNVEGLVIDLQDNGGGSIDEAQRLVGMFIGIGPIAILSDSHGKQTIMQDMQPGTVYHGPIVILINGQSASASELFASALQDYNRAFILGSRSSGKASMQGILPLTIKKRKDFIKMTLQKFYRVTGESCQSIGITPDVAMPVLFDSIVPREESLKNALKNNRLKATANYNEYTAVDNDQVRMLSRARIQTDLRLEKIKSLNSEINSWYAKQKTPILLTLDAFFTDAHGQDQLFKDIKSVTEEDNHCIINNTSYDKAEMKFDPFQQEINSYKLKELKSNAYLEEAINVIRDFNKGNEIKH